MSKNLDTPDVEKYQRWEAPKVTDLRLTRAPNGDSERLTVRDIEQIQQRAYDDGFRLGRQEGLAAAKAQAQHFSRLLGRFSEPLADLDDQVVNELLITVKALTRQLVRREMKAAPEAIVAVVREAVSVLPSSAQDIEIHLHPEDAKLVREILSINDENPTWRLTEDPVLTQGDCRVITAHSQIDAGLEARLNALISEMLGGERDGDCDPDS